MPRVGGVADREQRPAPLVWPIPVAAAIAALWSAFVAIGSIVVLFAVGWVFTADPRSSVGDAVKAAAASWLLAQSVPVTFGGVTIGLTPLLLTAGLLFVMRLAIVWSVRSSRVISLAGALGLLVTFTITSAVVAVGISQLLAASVQTNTARSALGAALWSLLGSWLGLRSVRSESGPAAQSDFSRPGSRTERRVKVQSPYALLSRFADLLPSDVRSGFSIGFRLLRVWLVIAVALALALLVWRFGELLQVVNLLSRSPFQSAQLLLLVALYLPSIALWAWAVLAGPGIAVGAAGQISLLVQSLAPLPAIPFLAVLPPSLPRGAVALLALPPIVAAVLLLRAQLSTVRQQLLVGISAALAAGVMAGLLGQMARGALAGGQFGTVGPDPLEIALFAAGWTVAGGFAAGLIRQLWRRGRSTEPHNNAG